jgi:hypothetical protein
MRELAPCVHPVRGIEPVVRGDGIVRSRHVVSTRNVVRAGDIAAHEAACGMAGKAMAMAGERTAAHAMRREPVHPAAVRMETATAHAETAARMETVAYMGAATTHAEGARTTAHVEGARAAANVHTATAATHVHTAAATAHVHSAAATAHVHSAAATAHVHSAAATTTTTAKCERVASGHT